jgi:hypothetical protein
MVVAHTKHAKVVWVDICLVLRGWFEVLFGRSGPERLMACRALRQPSNFEPLRGRIADDDGIVMSAARQDLQSAKKHGKALMTTN